MKTIRLFSIALTVAMLFTSSALFAQLKVGTNPTTIGANSNLEVEASTAGRKVIVDKTTGQVTIADGTQAAGKVLTSDANGAASWDVAGAGSGLGAIRTLIQGYAQNSTYVSTFRFQSTDFSDIPGAAVDEINGVISLPAGTYRVSANLTIQFSTNNPGNQSFISLAVNGTDYSMLNQVTFPTSNLHTYGGSALLKLTVPGQISLTGGGTSAGGFIISTGGYYSNLMVEKIR